MTACGTSARSSVVALEGRGLAVAIPVGLEGDLRDLAAVGPAGGDALGATRRAAMQQNHAGIVGERLIEHLPDALVIVASGAAGKGDARAFRQMHLGFGAALGGKVFAAFEERGGQLGVVDEAAGAGPPCGTRERLVVLARTVAQIFEDLAAFEKRCPSAMRRSSSTERTSLPSCSAWSVSGGLRFRRANAEHGRPCGEGGRRGARRDRRGHPRSGCR